MIRCIAIDDEPLALKQMADYIRKTPFLELMGEFVSALEAIAFLDKQQADLMFVDINMPDLNGMDFVKSLQKPPRVIFTTAYSEYAVEGFRVDAVDYLLKPIAYPDFLKAAAKARDLYFSGEEKPGQLSHDDKFLFVKSEYRIIRIQYRDILYVEGMREYVRIHIEKRKAVMALMSMKKMAEHLPSQQFMRVHRSYIVNLGKIEVVERNRIVFDGGHYIPVGEQYKEAFQQFLDENFLK